MPTATEHTLITVQALNQQVIWAVGGRRGNNDGSVVRTTDAGRTWQNVTPPDGEPQEFRDIHAFDANNVLVLTTGNGEESKIYRTADGGRTWQTAFTNSDAKAFYDGMTFLDDDLGFAISDAVGQSFPIVVTSDGGQTWQPSPQTRLPAALDGEFLFATGTTVIAVGRHDAWFATAAKGRKPRVFHTANRGASWTVADLPVPESPADLAGPRSLAFRDRRHGLVVGGTPQLDGSGNDVGFAARTSDGGTTWTLATEPSSFRNGAASIQGSTAVVVGNGSDLTTDEGQTWRRFDNNLLLGVSCPTPQQCRAVGEGGKAARLMR